MAQKIELYFASSFKSLIEQMSNEEVDEMWSAERLINWARRSFQEAEKNRKIGNEELQFVFLYRIKNTLAAVPDTYEYDLRKDYFDKKINTNKFKMALKTLKTLSNTLKKRYREKDLEYKREVAQMQATSRKYCDFVIASASGTVERCCKELMKARVPVFKVMLEKEGNCKEVKERKVVLNYSGAAVKALTQYIFGEEEWKKSAMTTPNIAFELLNLAHQYQIKEMEEKMKFMIVTKPRAWISVNAAVRLNIWSTDLVEDYGLKRSSLLALKHFWTNNKLKNSLAFKELKKGNRKRAKQLLEEVKKY
ncbi:unnamed protein product [Orchesella dallaii]|uniref:Uncharacterized protein n=1 Tax=Orchesella dallaii TaxID=48710 RepID=A0ABP1Q212_9HEXA